MTLVKLWQIVDLRNKLLLTLKSALFLRRVTAFRTSSLISDHWLRSICNAARHFAASLPFASSSLSNMINCFRGNIVSLTILLTNALKKASFVSVQHTTEGNDEVRVDVPSALAPWLTSHLPLDRLLLVVDFVVDFIFCARFRVLLVLPPWTAPTFPPGTAPVFASYNFVQLVHHSTISLGFPQMKWRRATETTIAYCSSWFLNAMQDKTSVFLSLNKTTLLNMCSLLSRCLFSQG